MQRGTFDHPSAEAALDRISVTAELTDLADRQLVVEAVTEDADAKTVVFTAVDKNPGPPRPAPGPPWPCRAPWHARRTLGSPHERG